MHFICYFILSILFTSLISILIHSSVIVTPFIFSSFFYDFFLLLSLII